MSQEAQFQDWYWGETHQKAVFRHEQALAWVKRLHPTSVMDIGCGDGFFLGYIRQYLQVERYGVDVSPVALERAKEQATQVFQADFSDYQPADVRVDVMVCLDVLEHLFQPQILLKRLHQHSSQLIISVPNFSSLPARLQVLFGRVPENNRPKKGHVFWFTYGQLNTVLASSGWNICEGAFNAPWSTKPFIGPIMRWLAKVWPSLFALSFVVLVETNSSTSG